MAQKTFEEQAAAAIDNPKMRLADMKRLIKSGEREMSRLNATIDQAHREAKDFRLSEADREAAAKLFEQCERRHPALTEAGMALAKEYGRRRSTAKQQHKATQRREAKAERDKLAASFKELIEPLAAEAPELFTAIQDNARLLKELGLDNLQDAEMHARGLSDGYVGNNPIARFTEMKLPNWDDAGNAWPLDRTAKILGVYDPKAAEKQQKEALALQRATFGRYRITPPSKQQIELEERLPSPRGKRTRTLHPEHSTIECNLDHAEADRIRKLGATVEEIEGALTDEALLFFN